MDEKQDKEKKALIEIDDKVFHELIAHCDEDYIANMELSDDEVKRVKKAMKKNIVSTGASVPMICRAEQCEFSKTCPLMEINKPPAGKICPVELYLLNKWKEEYKESLGVDWNDKVDRALTSELLELDIIGSRANSLLANEGLIMENVVGINEQTGEPVTRKEKHIALDVKEMVYKRRSKLLQEMIATREAKAKFMHDLRGDPAQYAANLRKKAEELKKKHANVIDVGGDEILEVDNEVQSD